MALLTAVRLEWLAIYGAIQATGDTDPARVDRLWRRLDHVEADIRTLLQTGGKL